jgi:transposase
MNQTYRVAGIDVHKKMLAVVVTDFATDASTSERRKFGTFDSELRAMAEWLRELEVQEAVMESTAQYWKPVWRQLEEQCRLYLAQPHSNRAPRGRKRDFQDAERLLRRHVAGELILSFVPGPEQRLWRAISRAKYQLTRDRVRLYGQVEALLEDSRIKLSSCVSDLFGLSARRMLEALAQGDSDPATVAAMAEPELRATPAQLADALQAAFTLSPLHRQILGLFLARLALIDQQIVTLERSLAAALQAYQQAVLRLAAVPGYGVDSAQQVIAEIGPAAATFPSAGELASWVGVCPGREESAEVSTSNRSPKGNRLMRRVLNQVANAAVRVKDCYFQLLYRRLLPRLGHNKAIWAVAHRLCCLTWKILHQGVDYIEFGAVRDPHRPKKHIARIVRQLRSLGYQVIAPAPSPVPQA